MLVSPIGNLRFGDRAAAVTAAGERITGTIQTFWGRIGGRRLVGLLKEGGSPLVPEMHFVPIEELQPLDERSGRGAAAPASSPRVSGADAAPHLGIRLFTLVGVLGAAAGAGLVGLALAVNLLLVDEARAGTPADAVTAYRLEVAPDCVYDPNLQAMICRVVAVPAEGGMAAEAGETPVPSRDDGDLDAAQMQRLLVLWRAMERGSGQW